MNKLYKLKRYVFGRAIRILSRLFVFLDWLTAKNPQLVIFMQSRRRYSDNARALFEYITLYCPNLRAVWIAKDDVHGERISTLFPEGQVVLRFTLEGFITAIRARAFVYTHGVSDLFPYDRPSTRKVGLILWHGISLKQFGLPTLLEQQIRPQCRQELVGMIGMTSSSNLDRLANCVCWGVPFYNVAVTGLPRNDRLFKPARTPPNLKGMLQGKVILYAPTFRDAGKHTEFFPFVDFDPHRLNQELARIGVCILLRPHPNDGDNQRRLSELYQAGHKRLVLADVESVQDIADILPMVEAVITDYSSVFFDLLLKDIPPIFIPYDLAEYEADRGLLQDYEAVTPGPKVYTQSDLINEIEHALVGAPKYATHRFIVRKLFHHFDDEKSSARTAEFLVTLMKRCQ